LKTITITFEKLFTYTFSAPITLIAESGGTKTDWRILAKDKIFAFETCNFHPKQINEVQLELIKKLEAIIPPLSKMYFFGSGCLSEENQQRIKQIFKPLELETLEVYSDLVAAGKAIYGNESGYIGILGTGSVVCHYSENKIDQITGGFGYLLGDEGSGYNFGKLVIQKYLQNQLSSELKEFIENTYGDKTNIISKVYSVEGKQFIGQLQLHSEQPHLQEEINSIHKENLNTFLELYITNNKGIKEIGFVGSYAYYLQPLLHTLLIESGIKLKQVIQKPINELVKEYFSK
jgi:glucosamine kinase